MNHELFEELLAAEALGISQHEERVALQGHLRSGCSTCRQLHSRFKQVSAALATVTVERSPSPELKTRLLREVRRTPSALSEHSKRPFLGWLLAPRLTWVTAGALAGGLAIFVAHTSLRSPQLYAQVIRSEGNLIVEGKVVGVNSKIPFGSSFSTGNKSVSDLRIANAAVFRMGPNSQVKLVKRKDQIFVVMKTGTILSHIKTGTQYAVLTPVATAEARGTVFFVKMDTPQTAYVCLCSGHLMVSAPGAQQELVSTHHQAVQVSQQSGKTVMAPAPMRDHANDPMFLAESF